MNEIWPVVIIVLQLIFPESILSIDNAAVIGALVTHLPDDHCGWKKRSETRAKVAWISLSYYELLHSTKASRGPA